VQLTCFIRKHLISVAAKVVDCSAPCGMGFQFLDLSPEDRAVIEMLRYESNRLTPGRYVHPEACLPSLLGRNMRLPRGQRARGAPRWLLPEKESRK
jgi:hypothetical protein